MIPAGFKFQQANMGGQFQDVTRVVHWNLGDLQPGQSKEVLLDLIPVEAGDYRMTAQVKTAGGLKTEAETRTVVEGYSALAIDVAPGDDPIEVGADTQYKIRVANTGSKAESISRSCARCLTSLSFRMRNARPACVSPRARRDL